MSNDSLLLASDSEPSDAPLMEVNQSQAMTRAQQEVQGAVLLAKKFPYLQLLASAAKRIQKQSPAPTEESVS